MSRFQLIVEGRVFKFEAESGELKQTWVKALEKCRDFAIQADEHGI